MLASSTPVPQKLPTLLSHDLKLAPGETLNFEIDGRVVTVHGTASDVAVISSDGNAVVVRPQPGDRFIVTGASVHHGPSELLAREDAIALAVRRLER
jgi:hypothetical protein